MKQDLKLGWWDVCVNVKDLEASKKFYKTFGLEVMESNVEQGYFVLKNDTVRIGFYKCHFEGFRLNFRGGDVLANSVVLKEKGLKFHFGPTEGKEGGGSATFSMSTNF